VCIGRVWAGHNIERFDSARIREAFAEIDKPAPEPKATFDSLPLLEERFGNRAGDMKVSISLFLKKKHLIR
jgi:DNA polymerase III epsilon subunit-like protein